MKELRRLGGQFTQGKLRYYMYMYGRKKKRTYRKNHKSIPEGLGTIYFYNTSAYMEVNS